MKSSLKIVLAQQNATVGDVAGNLKKVLAAITQATAKQADVILFPELFLSGYPADDLWYRPAFITQIENALTEIQKASSDITVIITHPRKTPAGLYNSASVFYQKKCLGHYDKYELPNYGVFDEKRYFNAGHTPRVIDVHGYALGIVICEDIWHDTAITQTVAAGAKLLLVANASPFSIDHDATRQRISHGHADKFKLPILYCNLVGGQDDLVFDGGSFAIMPDTKNLAAQADFFKETLLTIEIDAQYHLLPQTLPAAYSLEQKVYSALVLGVRDYVLKNGFTKVILGLSGGIDSALTLAIACDALGADHVEAILMPSRYTSLLSNHEAIAQATKLNCRYQLINIEPMYEATLKQLEPLFKDLPVNIAEQNIQARSRGIILMALSNKFNSLVLTTGNRSELAMGYSTLYGDMAGGFCVLKDVSKTRVYALANYRNKINAVIPQAVIDRAPTAELAPNQKDQDTLPPYDILDRILELYIQEEKDLADIVNAGFEADLVRQIIHAVERNEYKRRQAPPGVRINPQAFGRDRRCPITSKFKQ